MLSDWFSTFTNVFRQDTKPFHRNLNLDWCHYNLVPLTCSLRSFSTCNRFRWEESKAAEHHSVCRIEACSEERESCMIPLVLVCMWLILMLMSLELSFLLNTLLRLSCSRCHTRRSSERWRIVQRAARTLSGHLFEPKGLQLDPDGPRTHNKRLRSDPLGQGVYSWGYGEHHSHSKRLKH